MATADLTMQLFRRLKQEFPEIPDHIIMSCVHMYPNNLQTCISVLSQQSSTYMHGPMSELSLNKVDKDHYNHYETSRPYPIQQHQQQQQQLHNQNLPFRYAGQKSYPGDVSMRRNTLTSSPTTNRGYHRVGSAPQSAPVVPNVYEPFQAEYRAKLSARSPIRGGGGFMHPHLQPQPPTVYVNDYTSQQHYNQYNYEVALNYDQGTCGTYSLSSSSSIQHHQSPHKVQAYVNACAAPLDSTSIELRAPFEPARHVTCLNINPVGPHLGLYRFDPRYMSPPSQQPPVMHSTSINMRLQPPSVYPQPRVQINTTGGGDVVYSASPGLAPTKSHFHITFNRATGSRSRQFAKPAAGAGAGPRQCSSSSATATVTAVTAAATTPSLSVATATTSLSFHSCSSSTTSASVMSGSVTVSSSVLQQRKCSVAETRLNHSNENNSNQLVTSTCQLMSDQHSQTCVDLERKLSSANFELDTKDENKNLSQLDERCDSDVAYVKALVGHQRAQMDRLHQKLNEDRLKLDTIRQQVSSMELRLYNRIKALKHPAIFNPDEMKKLREETRKLRVECDCMSREVDFLVKGQVPLGETSEDFYKHINPGQSGSVGTPPSSSGLINRRPSATPPLSSHQEHDDDSRQWSCSQCTFLNNPALYKCEICEMPRISSAADFA